MSESPSLRFIDPLVLSRIRSLQLIAKTVVEGFVTGLHRSPYHGFSLNFSEYRQYAPGDDIRSVDWKVFGRTDRFYVKKYEGDTNCQMYILLDNSASMGYASGPISKIDYARFLAASLSYLAVRQSDAAGLAAFDSGVFNRIPPRAQYRHFLTILHRLEHLELGSRNNIGDALEELARLIRKRSIVVLISDFYHEVEELSRTLRFFHHRGNDVILFHLLDPVELKMPLADSCTLQDMETSDYLSYDPDHSRASYLELLQKHIGDLQRGCRDAHIDYSLLSTEEPLDRALYNYLSARQRRY